MWERERNIKQRKGKEKKPELKWTWFGQREIERNIKKILLSFIYCSYFIIIKYWNLKKKINPQNQL